MRGLGEEEETTADRPSVEPLRDRARAFVRGALGSHAVYVLVGLSVLALTRAGELTGPNRHLDGDEAIVALMARAVVEGGEVPVFFWGQHYGLSIVESAAGALAFALLGRTDVALRVAMLALFAFGWLAFSEALRRFDPRRRPPWAGLLLLVCPAFQSWSAIARGGYLTAFVLCQIVLLVYVSRPRARGWLAIGLLLPLIFLAQVTWALALVPFAAAMLRSRPRRAQLLAAGAGMLGVGIGFLLLGGGEPAFWSPDAFHTPSLADVLDVPRRVWITFTGSFYYDRMAESGAWTRAAALAWCVALGGIVPLTLLGRSEHRFVTGPALASILMGLLTSIVIGTTFHHRYLLPVASMTVFAIGAVVPGFRGASPAARSLLLGMLLLLGALGVASSFDARAHTRFRLADGSGGWAADDVPALIEDLERHGIAHVYVLQPMLQWSVMFYSDERVLARWVNPRSRRPRYPLAVDEALLRGGRVALAGPTAFVTEVRAEARRAGYGELAAHRVGEWLSWIDGPDPDLLRALGFELNEVDR